MEGISEICLATLTICYNNDKNRSATYQKFNSIIALLRLSHWTTGGLDRLQTDNFLHTSKTTASIIFSSTSFHREGPLPNTRIVLVSEWFRNVTQRHWSIRIESTVLVPKWKSLSESQSRVIFISTSTQNFLHRLTSLIEKRVFYWGERQHLWKPTIRCDVAVDKESQMERIVAQKGLLSQKRRYIKTIQTQ